MPLDCEHVQGGFGDLIRWCGGELVRWSLGDRAQGRANVDHFLELAFVKERNEGGGDAVDGKHINVKYALEIGPEVGRINVSVDAIACLGPKLTSGKHLP
jgi:hypothetical protein